MSLIPTSWNLETEFLQGCNCDYGCPCNFNGLPTHGGCEALNGFHVTQGEFGGKKLDGVKFAFGLWWPKAIHEGNGAGRLYLDHAATPDQKSAIQAIASGKHGGGVFEVFPKTFTRVFPAKAGRIEWRFAGHDTAMVVEGVGEVRSHHIKNPVTGEKFEGQILLPGGIAWKRAEVTSMDWSLVDAEAGWNMRYRNASGFVTTIRMNEKGPL